MKLYLLYNKLILADRLYMGPRHFAKLVTDEEDIEDDALFGLSSINSGGTERASPFLNRKPLAGFRSLPNKPATPTAKDSWVIRISGVPGTWKYSSIKRLLCESLEINSDDSEVISQIITDASHGMETHKKLITAYVSITSRKLADKLIDKLQDVYIGFGCHLHLDFSSRQEMRNATGGASLKMPFKPSSKPEEIVSIGSPPDIQTLRMINLVIENVITYGPRFEAALMQRESHNPQFEFLFNDQLPLHSYYLWRLLTVANFKNQLDNPSTSLNFNPLSEWPMIYDHNLQSSRAVPASMFRPPTLYQPPISSLSLKQELSNIDDDLIDIEEAVESANKKEQLPYLGKYTNLHLKLLLKFVTYRRGSIARIMAFAMAHPSSAGEIVELICRSIESHNASTKTRVARLYAVGDILYNSLQIPQRGHYISLFQTRLPKVFETLHNHLIHLGKSGRISADNFRRQITALLVIWDGWNLFSLGAETLDITGLKAKFLYGNVQEESMIEDESEPVAKEILTVSQELSAVPSFNEASGDSISKSSSIPQPGEYDGKEFDYEDNVHYKRLLTEIQV